MKDNKTNKGLSSEKLKYNFRGWADEGCENPTENGFYLCLVRWHNSKDYEYKILEYHTNLGWEVTDSCEHILWTNLPPSPFDK
jgi:hypothetical protein